MAQMSGSDWNIEKLQKYVSRERPLQPLQLLGHLAQVAHDLQHLLADGPEDVLGHHPLRQRQVAEVEELQRLFLVLEGVVVGLEDVLARYLAVGLEQVLHDARGVRTDLLGRLADVELADAQDVDHQHRVVGDHGAPRLRHDGRVRHAAGVADLLQGEHDVVRVLLRRVVHRRGEVRLRAVVVDAEPAARVEVLQRRAHLGDLDVEAPRLAQRVLDGADGGDLAAEVEVQELEAAQQVVGAQEVDRLDHLARRQAELRPVAARRLPAARPLGGQLDADADARPHAELLGRRRR